MYIISILAVIIISKFSTFTTEGIFYPLNPYPLILMLLFSFSLLAGTGLLRDFNNAFRLSIWKKNCKESANELRRAIEAVSLVRKILIASGAFLFFFEASQILFTMDLSPDSVSEPLGMMIAHGLTGPLYSATIILVLLPMESMLKLKLWNAQKAEEILKDRELRNVLMKQEVLDSQPLGNEQEILDSQHSGSEQDILEPSNRQRTEKE